MVTILDRGLRNPRYLAFLRIIAVAVWVGALFFLASGPGALNEVPSTLAALLDVLAAAVALIAIPGSFILWISMLYYWRHVDKIRTASRIGWFVLIFFGFCFGASVYCWLRVRIDADEIRGTGRRPSSLRRRALGIAAIGSWIVCFVIALLGSSASPILSRDAIATLALVFATLTLVLNALYAGVAIFSKGTR